MFQQREHVGNHFIQVDDGALGLFRGVGPRQVEQPVDDARGAEGLLLDLLEQRRPRIRRIGVLEQHLRVARDAGERRVDLVRHAGGEQAQRGHLFRDAQLLFHLRALGDVFEDHDRAAEGALARGRRPSLQRHGGQVDEQRLAVLRLPRAADRHAEGGVAVGILLANRAQQLEDVRIEQAIDGLAEHRRARHPVEAFERGVPADHVVARPDHQQPVIERLEDVFVERVEAIQLRRLEMQLAIEAAVFDRGRGLRGDGGDKRGVFGAERLAAGPPAERQHGDRGILRDAGHEVIDAVVAPELDLFRGEPRRRQRIVEADGVRAVKTRADAGHALQPAADRSRSPHG